MESGSQAAPPASAVSARGRTLSRQDHVRGLLLGGLAAGCGLAMALPFTDRWQAPAWFALAPIFYLAAAARSTRRAAALAAVFSLT